MELPWYCFFSSLAQKSNTSSAVEIPLRFTCNVGSPQTMPFPDRPSPSLRSIDPLRGKALLFSATGLLILVNLLVATAMLLSGAGFGHSNNDLQLAWGANFGPATQDGQWWRLGSALFLHFGLIHLSMNMLALGDVGRYVERAYGLPRFVAVYFISGLSGNLLSLFVHGERAVSGGASGAIFGLYGALLIHLWFGRRTLQRREFLWLFWGSIAFSGAMIVIGFVIPHVDNAAHLGGLATGLLAGGTLTQSQVTDSSHSRVRFGSAALLVLYFFTIAIKLPAPTYRWRDEQSTQHEITRVLREDAAISAAWESLVRQDPHQSTFSFNSLAGQVESRVADRYKNSFEEIEKFQMDPDSPSAATLSALREYTLMRRDASRIFVDGLRNRDQQKINKAIDLAQRSRSVIKDSPGIQYRAPSTKNHAD